MASPVVSAQDSGPALARKVSQSLFLLQTEYDGGWGSAFLFGDTKTLITNKHVVYAPGQNSITAYPVEEDQQGSAILGQPLTAQVRWLHPHLDLAVVGIPPTHNSVPIPIAKYPSDRALPRGSEVWAHGFPTWQTPMISKGIISGHVPDDLSGSLVYVIDAALALGSSGGPVTNSEGELIGVAAALTSDEGVGLGFNWGHVIPAPLVSDIFSKGVGLDYLPDSFDLAKALAAIRGENPADKRASLALISLRDGAAVAQTADELAEIFTAVTDELIQNLQSNLTEIPVGARLSHKFRFGSVFLLAHHMWWLDMCGSELSEQQSARLRASLGRWNEFENLLAEPLEFEAKLKLLAYDMRIIVNRLKSNRIAILQTLDSGRFWEKLGQPTTAQIDQPSPLEFREKAGQVATLAIGIAFAEGFIAGLPPPSTEAVYETQNSIPLLVAEIVREIQHSKSIADRLPLAAADIFTAAFSLM